MIRTIFAFALLFPVIGLAQNSQKTNQQNDVNAPLHLMQPEYETPYKIPTAEGITKVIDKVYNYLEAVTPPQLTNASGTEISDFSKIDAQTKFKQGDFRLISYEWGVTYAGMLLLYFKRHKFPQNNHQSTETSRLANFLNLPYIFG